MSDSSPVPSVLWFHRFSQTATVETVQRHDFTRPHLETFFKLARASSMQDARIWLFGALMNDACIKAEKIREASRTLPEDV